MLDRAPEHLRKFDSVQDQHRGTFFAINTGARQGTCDLVRRCHQRLIAEASASAIFAKRNFVAAPFA